MNTMKLPGFNAEASLGRTQGKYRASVWSDRSGRGEVYVQLDDPLFHRPKALSLRDWDKLVKNPGPEFGTETCDTGQADCAKRCTSQLNAAYRACATNPNADDRKRCYDNALTAGSACQRNCSDSFGPPSPACPPIGL